MLYIFCETYHESLSKAHLISHQPSKRLLRRILAFPHESAAEDLISFE
jgi:hypothetical protein